MNNTNVANNDEVDLVELIKVLWAKKHWIVISAFIFTLIAGIYAFTAKEQWTSKSVVISPKTEEFSSYYNLRQEYARILDLSNEEKESISSTKLSEQLFGRFKLSVESLDVRRRFFIQSDYYKMLIEGKLELEQQKILTDLVTKNIAITKPDLKKDPEAVGTTISLSAETADESQSELQKFIAFANSSALQTELNEFTIDLNEMISDLQHEKVKFETDLQIQKNSQLTNLENALNIAREAGIRDYAESFSIVSNNSPIQAVVMSPSKAPVSDLKSSDNLYLFMLGEKYLKAQIDVLKQNNVIYPPRYYEVSTLLTQLEPLLTKVKEVKANTFSYQASPDYPVQRDWPKRFLLLAIGFGLGLLIGSTVILGKAIISNKN